MSDLNRDTLVYEGVFRIYRNAMTDLVRRRLQGAYGDAWEERIRKPLQKQWDQVVGNAEGLRKAGVITNPIRDAADYLGPAEFLPMIEAYYSDLWPERTEDKDFRAAVQMWAKQTRLVRDPVAHPQDEELAVNDAYVVLDAARRILDSFSPEAAQKVGDLRDQVMAPFDENAGPLAVLPPREDVVVDFVGRADVLRQLHVWFKDPQSRRWLLCGYGGKGKSAIAYEFATQIARSNQPSIYLVLWLSAKRKRFAGGQMVPMRSDFTNLPTALRRTLDAYGAPMVSDDEEQARKEVLIRLREVPALIIVDDIDSLEGEAERAIEFFTLDVPTTPSKVLLTSRRPALGFGNSSTEVSGLGAAEGTDFVRSRMKLYQIDEKRLSPDAIDRILKATDGSPLFIEDLLRLICNVSPSDALREWTKLKGNPAREYALKREVEMMSATARQALIALALIDGPASVGEVRATMGVAEDTVLEALAELGRLFLVPQPALVEDQERYSLNVNTRALVQTTYGNTPEGRSIASAIQRIWDQGSVPSAEREAAAICRQAVVLAHAARYDEARAIMTDALEGSHPNQPRLLAQLGWLYTKYNPPRLADARAAFGRAAELNYRNAEMYWHWARLELRQDDADEARRVAELGISRAIQDHPGLLIAAGAAHDAIGKRLGTALQDLRAREEFEAARSYFRRAAESPAVGRLPTAELSRLYRDMARILRRLDDDDSLDDWLKRWGNAVPEDPYLRNELASVRARRP